MCIDKDNFQHEQQRDDNHARAELAQTAGVAAVQERLVREGVNINDIWR